MGVNILPAKGKLCNFDCVYCECGWNRDGRTDSVMPDRNEVAEALERKLDECLRNGTRIDTITFSGNGEPTLNPDFAGIVDKVIEIRNRKCPSAAVSVLSNASMLDKDEVVEALKKVDNPILKMDAVSVSGGKLLNRPQCDWKKDKLVEGLRKFNGGFILQTMFLASDFFDTADIVDEWTALVEELKPRKVMVYTLDRETAQKGLRKYTPEEMAEMVRPLTEKGYDIQING